MEKLTFLCAGAAFVLLSSSHLHALNLTITNTTNAPIQVFYKPSDTSTPGTKKVSRTDKNYNTLTVPAGASSTNITIDEKAFGSNSFDIIASSSPGSTIDPDWRLLAGTCKGVSQDATILVESAAGGLKTTCQVVPNP